MQQKPNTFTAFSRFIFLAYGITWIFWIPAALLQQDVMTFPSLLLHTLGGFGPSLAGVFMIISTRDRAEQKDFWRRCVNFRQVGLRWTVAILAFFPLLALAAIAIANLTAGTQHSFSALQRIAAQPWLLAYLLLVGLIAGPIPEELGWRGYALDALQGRVRPILASVLIGLFWGVWHLPLFFIPGTPQYQLGLNSLDFWLFLLNPIPLSALFAWVYYQTSRSILSAILMHLSFNVTTNLFYPLSPQEMLIHAALLLLLMLPVLIHWKRKPIAVLENSLC